MSVLLYSFCTYQLQQVATDDKGLWIAVVGLVLMSS